MFLISDLYLQGDIVEQVHKDALTTLLKPGTEMPKLLGLRLWPKAIPQFNIGHMGVLDRAEKALKVLEVIPRPSPVLTCAAHCVH